MDPQPPASAQPFALTPVAPLPFAASLAIGLKKPSIIAATAKFSALTPEQIQRYLDDFEQLCRGVEMRLSNEYVQEGDTSEPEVPQEEPLEREPKRQKNPPTHRFVSLASRGEGLSQRLLGSSNLSPFDYCSVDEADRYLGSAFENVPHLALEELGEASPSIKDLRKGQPPSSAVLAVIANASDTSRKRKRESYTMSFVTSLFVSIRADGV